MKTNNLYDNTAFLYDLDNRDIVKADIPFLIEYGEKVSGDILELACGTGRVSIELACSLQKNIYAMDLSKTMLERFYIKAERLPPDAKKRLNILYGDMSQFSLPQKFGMIFIPFRSFQVLTTEDGASNCLKCVYDHLNDDGIFILHVFKVLQPYDQSWVGHISHTYDVVDPVTAKRVRRSTENKTFDIESQVIQYLTQYRVNTDEHEEYIEDLVAIKYYYYEQIRNLLDAHGFIVEDEYGYYDKRAVSEGEEMIFVCSKRI